MAKLERVIEQVKEILQEDTRGLTIQELSEQTKVTRITTSLALMRLVGSGLVVERVIGNCKLHYWKKRK
jgi:predicted transcriptional regulator